LLAGQAFSKRARTQPDDSGELLTSVNPERLLGYDKRFSILT